MSPSFDAVDAAGDVSSDNVTDGRIGLRADVRPGKTVDTEQYQGLYFYLNNFH